MAATTYDEQLEREREQIAGQQDLAGGEVDEVPDVAAEDPVLDGTVQLDLFGLGGKRPTAAKVTLRGKTLQLAAGTSFAKGQRLRVSGVIVIDAGAEKDKRDKATGLVTGCDRTLSGCWETLTVDAAEDGE